MFSLVKRVILSVKNAENFGKVFYISNSTRGDANKVKKSDQAPKDNY